MTSPPTFQFNSIPGNQPWPMTAPTKTPRGIHEKKTSSKTRWTSGLVEGKRTASEVDKNGDGNSYSDTLVDN